MKPSRITYTLSSSSLGQLLLAKSEAGVCTVFLGDDRATLVNDLQRQFPSADLLENADGLEKTMKHLRAFIEQPHDHLDLQLDMRGTPFQQRVWQALRKIPAGKTVTYLELARSIGAPRSFRAVAKACGANTLAIVVPCHRVVRSDGGLAGYRWGVERKRALLGQEQAETARLLAQARFSGAAAYETSH